MDSISNRFVSLEAEEGSPTGISTTPFSLPLILSGTLLLCYSVTRYLAT